MDSNKVDVSIGGIKYTIVADTKPDTTKEIAKYIDLEINDIKNKNKRLSTSMIHILTMMNITAELFKLKKAYASLEENFHDPNDRCGKLEEEIKVIEDEKLNLNSKLENLKDELVSSLNTISEMNKQKESLESEYKKAKTTLEAREDQLRKLTSNLERLQVDLIKSQKSYQDLDKKSSGGV